MSGGDRVAAASQPSGHLGLGQSPRFARGTCPAGKNFQLHAVIMRPNGPVGRALYYGIAERSEVCDRSGRRCWPECGAEAFVGALMCVDRGEN